MTNNAKDNKVIRFIKGDLWIVLLDAFVVNAAYFLALVVFTIITRMVLFPLNLRQQKTMAKTAKAAIILKYTVLLFFIY